MKKLLTLTSFLIFSTTIFAQEKSSNILISDSSKKFFLFAQDVLQYNILGGFVDWWQGLEYQKNRVPEFYNSQGSEGDGSFMKWKTEIPAFKIGCDSGDCTNGIGKYIDSNANIYIGQFKNGKKNGQGKMKYFCYPIANLIYDGSWVDDKREGLGKFGEEIKNSNVAVAYFYIGNWKDDFWAGQGTLIARGPTGNMYKGNFDKGFTSGNGILIEFNIKNCSNENIEPFASSLLSFSKVDDIPEAAITKKSKGNFFNIELPESSGKNEPKIRLDGSGSVIEYYCSGGTRFKESYTGVFKHNNIKIGTEIYQDLANSDNDWKLDAEWAAPESGHGYVGVKFGRKVWKNGQKYEGDFQNATVFEGLGKFTYSNRLNGRSEGESPVIEEGVFKSNKYIRPFTSDESITFSKRLQELDNSLYTIIKALFTNEIVKSSTNNINTASLNNPNIDKVNSKYQNSNRLSDNDKNSDKSKNNLKGNVKSVSLYNSNGQTISKIDFNERGYYTGINYINATGDAIDELEADNFPRTMLEDFSFFYPFGYNIIFRKDYPNRFNADSYSINFDYENDLIKTISIGSYVRILLNYK